MLIEGGANGMLYVAASETCTCQVLQYMARYLTLKTKLPQTPPVVERAAKLIGSRINGRPPKSYIKKLRLERAGRAF